MKTKLENKELSIVFIPTWDCNCTCDHCFEKIVPQTIKEELFEKFFLKIKELVQKYYIKKLLIYWQGGDVLIMDPEKVRNALQIGENIFSDTNCVVEHHLQTNLLLYNSKWGDIIHEYFSRNISSSMDYPNVYRKTKTLERNEYVNLWKKKKLEAEKDGFIVSVIALPNKKTLDYGGKQFYSYFKDELNVKNLQINFPFPGVNGDKPEILGNKEYFEFLKEVYGEWTESGRGLNLSPFSMLEQKFSSNNGTLPCIWSYSCANNIIAVSPELEVGQCDCWISTQNKFNFGCLINTPVEKLLDSKKRKIFLDRPLNLIEDNECGECKFWKICYGGCPIRAYSFTKKIFSKDYYCFVYKNLFEMVLKECYNL